MASVTLLVPTLNEIDGMRVIMPKIDRTLFEQILVLDGGSINVTGTLTVPTLLSFASAGNVSEGSGAAISVTTLTGSADGTIGLIGANSFGTLDALSAGGNITVNNIPSLIIAGTVSTGIGNSITLDDGSDVTEISGGGLSAGVLAGSIGGSAYLTTGNTIGTLNGLTVDGLLEFIDGGPGPLYLGYINAGNGYFSANGIEIFGPVTIGAGAGDLGFDSTAGITETTALGTIAAGELYGFERVHMLFTRRPDAEQASESAVSFGQDDDITVLTLERLPEPA